MNSGRALRFAAVLVVLTGYLCAFRGGERRIAEARAENARTLERLRAAERAVAARGAFETERGRLRARLGTVPHGIDRSLLVARFLRDAVSIGVTHRATITAVSGGPPAFASGAAAPAQAMPAFEPIPLELIVEGRYADVLAMLQALSQAPVPAAVEVVSLTRKETAVDPTIVAALRIVLERIAPLHPARADGRARPV